MVLDGNAVRSVDRAAALLLALGRVAGRGRASPSSPVASGCTSRRRRGCSRRSRRRGLVEQDDDTGKYRLGLVVIRLAEQAERTLDLRGIAAPELERLARLTHETTGIGILDGETRS